jgi:hypothetical protein
MKIVKYLLQTVFAISMLYIITRTLVHPNKKYYDSPAMYVYSKGNAPDEIRLEIIQQLNKFQDGYTKRDTSLVNLFMKELFSKNNILILGTMPFENCSNYEKATRLVFADFYRWGDCTFLINNSNISSSGNIAWFSTIGYVKFDLSRFLVLPLRLTGIMVKDNSDWKFQQLQFQFDLDLTYLLITIFLLIIWVTISIINLIVAILRQYKLKAIK